MNTLDLQRDRLYQLLPAIHRLRDAEQGEPLRALLQVMAEQLNLLEEDIGQLYENWFIETCDEWVVPYIADLLGHEPLDNAAEPKASGANRRRISVSRQEVANTIRYRRRKGSIALLEQLAVDVGGWPARAVEFYRYVAQTQSMRGLQPERGRVLDLRASDSLALLGSPFDYAAYSADMRRIDSRYTPGRYNIANIGLFVWRLGVYSVTRVPACCLEEVGPRAYAFSTLGNDMPLFTNPSQEEDTYTIADELNLPVRIRRRAFTKYGDKGEIAGAAPAYYGLVGDTQVGRSLAIWADGWSGAQTGGSEPIPASQIIPADLGDWSYVPPRNHVAVDPVLGRFVFPPKQLPKQGVWVSYHYAFSADMGGGEYPRSIKEMGGAQVLCVRGQEELRNALRYWQRHTDIDGRSGAHPEQPQNAVIEIADSGVYVVPVNIDLAAGSTLQIRAAQCVRPVLQLLNWKADSPDSLTVTGGQGSRMIIDGLTVSGRGIQVEGDLASLVVRHTTLVPGWSLRENCKPQRPTEPSIELLNTSACLVIDHSIVGSIQINSDEVSTDPVSVRISDSIVDATNSSGDGPESEAIGAAGSERAHANLHIARSTLIGQVMAHTIELAENSIFLGNVNVARRQIGCMRFCYVQPCSRTPKRFNCQPDLVKRAVADRLPPASASEIETTQQQEAQRVRPRFNSVRYGTPDYCQLACDCAEEITRGADDEAEMGVFHNLYQPQRLANLRTRINEYTPAAMDVGIIIVN